MGIARKRVIRRMLSMVGGVTVVGALVSPAGLVEPASAAAIAATRRRRTTGARLGGRDPAALANPRCRHDDPKYGAYGRFDNTEVGGGPVCVKPWKAGTDNGGATAPG